MKLKIKLLMTLLYSVMFIDGIQSQCVQNCSQYILSPITFTTFPTAGNSTFLSDDDTTAFIPLGFNFDFYCTTYNKAKICSNGFITFDNSPFTLPSTPYAQSLPSGVIPNSVIAYNWNDLDPTAGGSITYTTIGVSPNQKFIVTYSAVPLWNITPQILNTGQIILNESDNSIEIHITSAGHNGWLTATEGIEDAAASQGLAVPGRNLSLWTATNSAHRWEKTYTPVSPTNLMGNVSVCYGSLNNYTCDPMPNAVNYFWYLPTGWVGSSNTTTIGLTAGFSGTLGVSASYSCGLSAPSTLSINILPSPNVSLISYSPTALCQGVPALFNVTGANTYTILPGGTGGNTPISFAPTTSGNYSLFGTDLNGCTSVSPATIFLPVNSNPLVSVNSGTACLGQAFNLGPAGAFSYNYSFGGTSPLVTPTGTGNFVYYVIGTSIHGCVGTATSNVMVRDNPTITAIASRSVICRGEETQLAASGANTFTWSNNTNGTTTTVTPLSPQQYTVIGTDAGGCYSSTTLSLNVSLCNGIAENSSSRFFVLYPNPNNGEFKIDCETDGLINLYNTLGEIIVSQKVEKETHPFSIKELPSGIYLIRFETKVGSQTTTFIKYQ